MKNIRFSSYDIADELEALLNGASDGQTVCLPEGRFLLSHKVRVKNKKGLTVRGENTVLVTPFDPVGGFEVYDGAFDFTGCTRLVFENFTFDTTVNVNSAGVVVATDAENATFDVKLFPDCALNGKQTIRAINSMDENGSPDYLFANYSATPYEMLDEHLARIRCSEKEKTQVARLPIGEQICFRHALGHFPELENSAITFHNCTDIVMRDITVHSSAGYMTVVFPRCHNMTIERYRVVVPEGSNRLMASNIDAIHLFGLSGKLTVRDCYFDGLGDDALNIHSTAGTVTEVAEGRLTVINGRFSAPLETAWCRKGDVIAAYTPEFVCKGHFLVEDYNDTCVTGTLLDGLVEVGDIVGNTAFYAETEITGCTVKNTRARGILLQTENISVRDCCFFGISRPAILLAPDIKTWHEVGPIHHAVIENCVFENCPAGYGFHDVGAITIRTSHNYMPETDDIVHTDITIRNNTFKNVQGDIVFAASVEGLYMEGNTILGGKHGAESEPEKTVKLLNCKNASIR